MQPQHAHFLPKYTALKSAKLDEMKAMMMLDCLIMQQVAYIVILNEKSDDFLPSHANLP